MILREDLRESFAFNPYSAPSLRSSFDLLLTTTKAIVDVSPLKFVLRRRDGFLHVNSLPRTMNISSGIGEHGYSSAMYVCSMRFISKREVSSSVCHTILLCT